MNNVTMIYWKGKKLWLGKLKEHPEIMTQGRTVKELDANLRDAYRMMLLEDVPEEYRKKSHRRMKRPEFIRQLIRDGVSSSARSPATTFISIREPARNSPCHDMPKSKTGSRDTYESTSAFAIPSNRIPNS